MYEQEPIHEAPGGRLFSPRQPSRGSVHTGHIYFSSFVLCHTYRTLLRAESAFACWIPVVVMGRTPPVLMAGCCKPR